jgi:hypothetical protein
MKYICGNCLEEKEYVDMEVIGVCDCCKDCWRS